MMKDGRGHSAILAALVVTVVTAAPARANDHELRKEGMTLIRQIEEVGRDVRYRADRLQQAAKNQSIVAWSHFHHLDHVKELVNSGLRPALVRLDQIQGQLPDWKQESIDRMIAAAKALAGDAQSALMTKLSNRTVPPILNEEYRRLVADLADHAADLVKTSEIAGEYATARLKAEEAGLKKPSY